jgi:hypothetical protein
MKDVWTCTISSQCCRRPSRAAPPLPASLSVSLVGDVPSVG